MREPLKAALQEGLKTSISLVAHLKHRKKALLTLLLLPIAILTLLSTSFITLFEQDYDLSTVNAAIIFDFDAKPPSEYIKHVDGQKLVSRGALLALDDVQAMDFKQLILKDFMATELVKSFKSVQELSKNEAFKLLRKDRLDILFVIDENFYGNYIVNTVTPLKLATEMKVVTSDDDYLKTHIAEQVMSGFAARMEKTWDVKNLGLERVIARGVPFNFSSFQTAIQALFEDDLGPGVITYKTELLSGRRAITAKDYYPVSTLILFWMMAAIYIARWPFLSLNAPEHQSHNLQALQWNFNRRRLASWLALWLSILWLGLLQLAIVVTWSSLVLGTLWPLSGLSLMIALISLIVIASFGTFLGMVSVSRGNLGILNILESLGVYLMAFVGGNFIPLAMLPDFFMPLSKLTLNGLMLNAYIVIFQGYGYWQVRLELGLLVGLSVLMLVLGTIALRRKPKSVGQP